MRTLCLSCLLLELALTCPSFAADQSLVSLGVGGTDIMNQQMKAAGDLRIEYRSGLSLAPFVEDNFKVKPRAGIETKTRQSIYDGGNGKSLGSVFEIRSTFEGGYVFDDGSRVVASFSNTSNAGVSRRNPGTEAALVSYQVPLNLLTGSR